MMPLDKKQKAERHSKYKELCAELDTSGISREEAFWLHMWLSDQASERVIEKAVANAVGAETIAEQISLCVKLEKSALVIADQFDFLRQVSSLEFSLAQAHNATERPTARRDDWRAFRGRLEKDAARLAQVAQRTIAELKAAGGKKGRPEKKWRNRLFTDLADYLRQRSGKTQEECSNLAFEVWNIYFPGEKIESSETVGKIAGRERRRRKNQGQNTA